MTPKSYPGSSFGSPPAETVGKFASPDSGHRIAMNKVAATSLALTLGLAGTYALREWGGVGGSPDSPEHSSSASAVDAPGAAGRPLPAPTGGADAPRPTSGPGAAADEVDGAAALVPLDAFCYLRIDSLGELEDFVRQAIGEIDPAMAGSFDARGALQMALASMGGEASLVDWQRPMGLALSMPGGAAQPVATAIVPVTSAERFVAGLQLPPNFAAPRTSEDYVGVAMGPNYRLGSKPAAIALDLPPGRIAARIHFDPIRALVGQSIQQVRQVDPRQLGLSDADAHYYRAGQEFAVDFYDDIEQLELGFDWGSAGTEMTFGTTFAEGSAFAMPAASDPVDASTLARMLEGDEDFVFASTWGPEFLEGPLRTVFERAIELADADEGDVERARMALALAPMAGRQFLAFGDIEVGAAHAGIVLRPPVVEPILDSLVAQIEDSPLGLLLVEPPVEHEREGGRDLRMRFLLEVPEDGGWSPEDTRALEGLSVLCGSDEVEVRLVSRGRDLAVLLGADAAWLDAAGARVGAESGADAEVDSRLAGPLSTLAGGSPTFLYRVDALAVMREAIRLSAEHMDLDPSEDLRRLERGVGEDPLEILSYGGADGRRWSATLRMDWARLGLLGQAIGG